MDVERTLRDGWVDPEVIFVHLAERADDMFWIDRGLRSASGWSMLGTGVPVATDTVASVDVAPGPARREGFDQLAPVFVGWLSYEDGALLAGLVPPEPVVESRWLRAKDVVLFNHETHEIYTESADQTFSSLVQEWIDIDSVLPVAALDRAFSAHASVSAEEYAQRIAACREYIRLGEAYQLCLTAQFEVPGEHDAVEVYRRLRQLSGTTRGGFIRIGDTTLVSGTPEHFLTSTGGRLSTRPIKGTRPRGATPQEDARLRTDLAASAKERAENVMIVDLMRNDFSAVCERESVRVDQLCEVETFPTVHQLVSAVSGTVAPGVKVGDLWRASFPAGSMTGAPKLRAMELLQQLEAHPRGAYAGCFGWVNVDGDMDLSMTIRTVVIQPGSAIVGAGGGITWGSVVGDEVAEVLVKTTAPFAALGASRPSDW